MVMEHDALLVIRLPTVAEEKGQKRWLRKLLALKRLQEFECFRNCVCVHTPAAVNERRIHRNEQTGMKGSEYEINHNQGQST